MLFSPERLRTYLTAAEGDRKRALQLYTWNAKIGAAFCGPLQGLEIPLYGSALGGSEA